MSIKPGDAIPDAPVALAGPDGPTPIRTGEFFRNRKVLLFAVPGAFTPTCSAQHLPGFIEHAGAIHEKGIDQIACLAVNDPFVLQAWATQQGVDDRIAMLADGSGFFTKALGQEFDAVDKGLGIRSQRYVMIVDNGTVRHLAVEQPGQFGVSSAESVLAELD